MSSRRDLQEWRPYCTVRYLGNWLLESMVKILFKHNGYEDDRENENRAKVSILWSEGKRKKNVWKYRYFEVGKLEQ